MRRVFFVLALGVGATLLSCAGPEAIGVNALAVSGNSDAKQVVVSPSEAGWVDIIR